MFVGLFIIFFLNLPRHLLHPEQAAAVGLHRPRVRRLRRQRRRRPKGQRPDQARLPLHPAMPGPAQGSGAGLRRLRQGRRAAAGQRRRLPPQGAGAPADRSGALDWTSLC